MTEAHYLFAAGSLRFAVPLAAVRRVHRVEEWTPVPRTPRYLLGVTQVLSEVLALLDLGRLRTAAPPAAAPLYAAIVEGGGLRAGLVSVELGRTVELTPDVLEMRGTSRADLRLPAGVRGWAALADGPAVVLDPAPLLAGLAPRWRPGGPPAEAGDGR